MREGSPPFAIESSKIYELGCKILIIQKYSLHESADSIGHILFSFFFESV